MTTWKCLIRALCQRTDAPCAPIRRRVHLSSTRIASTTASSRRTCSSSIYHAVCAAVSVRSAILLVMWRFGIRMCCNSRRQSWPMSSSHNPPIFTPTGWNPTDWSRIQWRRNWMLHKRSLQKKNLLGEKIRRDELVTESTKVRNGNRKYGILQEFFRVNANSAAPFLPPRACCSDIRHGTLRLDRFAATSVSARTALEALSTNMSPEFMSPTARSTARNVEKHSPIRGASPYIC